MVASGADAVSDLVHGRALVEGLVLLVGPRRLHVDDHMLELSQIPVSATIRPDSTASTSSL